MTKQQDNIKKLAQEAMAVYKEFNRKMAELRKKQQAIIAAGLKAQDNKKIDKIKQKIKTIK